MKGERSTMRMRAPGSRGSQRLPSDGCLPARRDVSPCDGVRVAGKPQNVVENVVHGRKALLREASSVRLTHVVDGDCVGVSQRVGDQLLGVAPDPRLHANGSVEPAVVPEQAERRHVHPAVWTRGKDVSGRCARGGLCSRGCASPYR